MTFPAARLAAALAAGAALLAGACFGPVSPAPSEGRPTASPTLLPPPVAISSPAPEAILSPGPTRPPGGPSTPIPAPGAQGSPPPTTASGAPGSTSPERVIVAHTEGLGANVRAEPAANAALVRTVREGTELEIVGADRETGNRRWRNVRDPSGGSTGWIVADLLAAAPSGARQAAGPAASGTSSVPGSRPPASPPVARSAASPIAAGAAGRATQRIDDADRAYLGVIQPHVEGLGKAISAANEQVAAAGGRPAVVEDPAWRQATETAARQLTQVAAGLRQSEPGPNTANVRSYALRAADRAEGAARLLTSATENRDARALASVTTVLVQALAEINNMNLALVQLQS